MKPDRGFKRRLPLVLFLLCYGLLLRAAAPTLVAGDAGELTVAAYSLGVAHPPGYPVFVLLGKLSTIVPCGGVAFRVTCMCAAAVAAGAAVLASLVRAAGAGWFAALLSALGAVATPAWFFQGTSTEVYALAVLLTVVLFRVCLAASRGGLRAGLAGWFVFGLGLTCHYWFVLLGPLLLYFTGKLVFRSRRRVCLAVLMVLVGVSTVLILPLRSIHGPDANWGTPVTARAFWHVLVRGQYGTSWSDTRSPGRIVRQVGHVVNESFSGWRLILPVLFVLGLCSSRIGRPERVLFLGGAALSGMGTVLVVNYGLSEAAMEAARPFLVPFHILVHGGAGIGLGTILRWLHERPWPGAAAAVRLLGGLGAAALLVGVLSHGSRRHDEAAYQFARNVFRTADVAHTVFITDHDDNYFPLWGVSRLAERWRSVPVRVICARMLCLRWYLREVARLYPGTAFPPLPEAVRSVVQNRRLRLKSLMADKNEEFFLVTSGKPALPEGRELCPVGLGYRVVPRGAGETAPQPVLDIWEAYNDSPSAVPTQPAALPERRLISYYGLGMINTAIQLEKLGRYQEALSFMERAERYLNTLEPQLLFPYYVRYGNLLVRVMQPARAAGYFRLALKLRPERDDIRLVLSKLDR